MKAIPYGISDFPRIRREDYYYVDKTRYIELMERQPSYLFLIRPRRFGKSLFLAILETYYSIDYADCFDELYTLASTPPDGRTSIWCSASTSPRSRPGPKTWNRSSANIAA